MLYHLLVPLIVTSAIFTASARGECIPTAISLPIRDVYLPNKAALRGVYAAVGTPQQNISIAPVIQLNNTYIFGGHIQNCQGTSSKTFCTTKYGANFIPIQSSSFAIDNSTTAANAAAADPLEAITSGSIIWGQDTLMLTSNTTVRNYSIELLDSTSATEPAISRASLGLGKNSTLLSMLKNAGGIGSSSWGLWYGLAGAANSAQIDGSLVLGGYDAAKIKSEQNYTGSFSDTNICPSGLTVTINSMVLNFPNGTNAELLNPALGSSQLVACLCTECPVLMSIPLDPYLYRFETFTNTISLGRSVGINFFTQQYPSGDVYQGDLTFGLDSGLSIRVPNSQLVLPDLTISNTTGAILSNDTIDDVLLYPLQDVNKNDIPRLGYYFLTSAYLLVNHDAGTFTLWEANSTTDTNLVALRSDGSTTSCSTATAPGASQPAASTPALQETKKNALSGGQIGGIVVGSVVAFAIAATFAFCLFHRRKERQPQSTITTGNSQPSAPTLEAARSSEHPVRKVPGEMGPSELANESLPRRELWAPNSGSDRSSHVISELN